MKYAYIISVGGYMYCLVELLWRGWTHWTMLLCGGVCFLFMYLLQGTGIGRVRKLLLCTAFITTAEFLTGCFVNLIMDWNVWDYSAMPLNLLGQICAPFSAMWLILSVPGMSVCGAVRRRIG